MKLKSTHIEIGAHLLFWLFYFTSVNVQWSANWFDSSLRPTTPSPLIALIFPFYFFINAFWLIPKFFNREHWPKYIGFGILAFLLPEVLRAFFYASYNETSWTSEFLIGRDSFIFGAPSPFFLALNGSFIYRFTKDWFQNRKKIKNLMEEQSDKEAVRPYEGQAPVTDSESKQILTDLKAIMDKEQLYLNADLNLRTLAKLVDTTDKKLSFVLNQNLNANFYDYLNSHRIEAFKKRLEAGDNQVLSLVGIALECGFKSKSSFYRAFKVEVGCSPSQYLKQINSQA